MHCVVCTNLLWIPQVKEVQVALVTHLLVCGEHDDVAAEVETARPDSGVGVEQGELLTYAAQRDGGTRVSPCKTDNAKLLLELGNLNSDAEI